MRQEESEPSVTLRCVAYLRRQSFDHSGDFRSGELTLGGARGRIMNEFRDGHSSSQGLCIIQVEMLRDSTLIGYQLQGGINEHLPGELWKSISPES